MKLPRRVFLLLLLCLITLSAAPALTAQQLQGYPKWFPASPIGVQTSATPAAQTEMEPMPLVAPIFLEDAKNSSSLLIANNSAINAGATITVRSLSGAEVGTIRRKLSPHEQQEISLQSLLTGFASPIVAGSITVTQDANLKGMAIAAQLLLTNFKASLPSYVDEELAMPSISGSATLRGVADEAAGTALLAITSIVNWEQHVTLRCLAETTEHKPAIISIAPYATSLVSSCSGQAVADTESYQRSVGQRQGSEIQGYELVTDGGPAAISAFGLAPHLRNQDLVFSAIPFTDPEEIHSPNSVFAGVPFGAQDALPNGVYKPRISFTNFAATPAHVKISVAATRPGDVPVSAAPGESPEKVTIRQLTIAPRRSVELALSNTVSQSGLLQSVFVETDKKPGEVLGKAVSRSEGNLFEVELLEKDQMDENNGGIHPWSVEGDSESHLLLFNYSSKPRVFGVGISNGVILWDKKYTLAPNETREISINELIQDEVPDGKGQVLRPGHERGVVNWMVPDSGEGTGRLMVTSRSKGMARNFSCGQFVNPCGAYVYADSGLTVGSIGEVIWVVPQFCDFFSPSQCVGGNDVSNGSANYNWGVGASSVARLNTPSDQYVASPQLYGVGAGGGYGNVTVTGGSCQVNGGGGYPVNPTVTFSQAGQGVAQGGTMALTATVNSGGSATPITLSLATNPGTGAAIFTSGGTIASGGASTVITSSTGITITGVTASSTAGNIILSATAPNQDGPGTTPVATNPQSFSVVNVTLSLLTPGTVPSAYPDSAVLPTLSLAPAVWPPDFGNYTSSDQSFCTTPYFVSGLVTPANYPGSVTLRRTIALEDLYTDPSNTPVAPTPISNKDDTSISSYNWNSPSESSGYVYDWDAPGIHETDGLDPTGEVDRLRANFSEYAVLGNSLSTVAVGSPMPLFARVSCAKLSTGAQLDTTFPGDNTAGPGTTKTSRTLQ